VLPVGWVSGTGACGWPQALEPGASSESVHASQAEWQNPMVVCDTVQAAIPAQRQYILEAAHHRFFSGYHGGGPKLPPALHY